MQKDFTAGIEELNTITVNAIKRLGEIQLRAMERLTEQQIAVTSEYLREGVKQMQTVVGAKDLSKAVESQANYISDFTQRAAEDVQKSAAILADSRSELSDWVEQGVKSVSSTSFVQAAVSKVART